MKNRVLNSYAMYRGQEGMAIAEQRDTARWLLPVSFEVGELPFMEKGSVALFVINDKKGANKAQALQTASAHVTSIFSRAHARCSIQSGHVMFNLDDEDPIRYRVLEVTVTCSALTERVEPDAPGEPITKDITNGTSVLYSPPNRPGHWYEATFVEWMNRKMAKLKVVRNEATKEVAIPGKRVRLLTKEVEECLEPAVSNLN